MLPEAGIRPHEACRSLTLDRPPATRCGPSGIAGLRKYFPFFVFAVVALVSLGMAGFAYVANRDAARIKFEAAADEALNRIESRVELHLGVLRTVAAFFSAQEWLHTLEQ